MKIVECRVIRPKDRRSVVLAAAELLFDNGIRVVNMHLLKPREGQEGNQLRMPVVHTKSGTTLNPFNPSSPEFRAAMHKAVEETLAEAVEAQVNDYTKTFETVEEFRLPVFSRLKLHKFPDNHIPVKAMVSVTIDGELRLNRIAVIKAIDPPAYVVQLPTYTLQGGRRPARYFRFQAEPYEALYKLVTDAYFKVAEVAADEPVQDTEEPA